MDVVNPIAFEMLDEKIQLNLMSGKGIQHNTIGRIFDCLPQVRFEFAFQYCRVVIKQGKFSECWIEKLLIVNLSFYHYEKIDYSWNLMSIGELIGFLPVPLLLASLFSPKKDSIVLDITSKSIPPESNSNPWLFMSSE